MNKQKDRSKKIEARSQKRPDGFETTCCYGLTVTAADKRSYYRAINEKGNLKSNGNG